MVGDYLSLSPCALLPPRGLCLPRIVSASGGFPVASDCQEAPNKLPVLISRAEPLSVSDLRRSAFSPHPLLLADTIVFCSVMGLERLHALLMLLA